MKKMCITLTLNADEVSLNPFKTKGSIFNLLATFNPLQYLDGI